MKMDQVEERFKCQHCGSDYTHHDKVTVFNRESEDSNRGLRVLVNGDLCRADSDMTGNPSSRRNGVLISLWCEECEDRSYITIVQHKGQTFVSTGRI